MEHPIPPPLPLSYARPLAGPPARLMIGGIVAILGGMLGVVSNAIEVYSIAALPAPGGYQPGIERSVALTMGGCGLVDTALAAVLMVAGVILVRDHPSARKWTLASAYPALAMTGLEFLIWMQVGPQVTVAMNAMNASRTRVQVPAVVSVISNLTASLFAIAFPLLMIWFVRNRVSREWFKRAAARL